MALTFRLTALTAPPGVQCLTTLQAVLNNAAKYLQVTGPPGVTVMIASETEPSTDDRDKIWVQLYDNGMPVGSFKYQDGWVLIPGIHVGAIIGYSGLISAIPAGWVLADGLNGSPDLTSNTEYASWWNPNYSAPTTTYDLCPIYFKGLAD